MTAKKICVVTGSRAEYGILESTIRRIAQDPDLTLQLVVTGMHLSPEFGSTYRQIERDGFRIDAKVESLLSSDTAVGISKSVGLGVIGFADAYERLAPDVVLVLGDRFEILAAAQAAMLAGIPIAHVHGGELTEGAFDDSIRHSITKMANIHFVAAEAYRKRVVQLGEMPESVFNVGAPSLDQLSEISWLDRAALESDLGIELSDPVLLVTYHPVTLSSRFGLDGFEKLLGALEALGECTLVFTYPNADTGGRAILESMLQFVERHAERSVASASLGQQRYLSVMKAAAVVVGNSSSGIIEAPALRTPTVNIGDRQKGRLRADSVIDVGEDSAAISEALRRAMTESFRRERTGGVLPYGAGGSARKIVDVLKAVNLGRRKNFLDLQHDY